MSSSQNELRLLTQADTIGPLTRITMSKNDDWYSDNFRFFKVNSSNV